MNDQAKGLLITTLGILFVVPDALFIRLIDAEPLVIAFWRSFLTGAVLLIGLILMNGTRLPKMVKDTGRMGALYAFFAGSSSVFFVLAISNTSVANVVFILAAMPVFAAFYSWIFMGERLSRRMVITIFFVMIGLSIITYGSSETKHAHWTGDLFALIACAFFAVAITAARVVRPISMVPAAPIAYLGAASVLFWFADPFTIQPDQYWLVALHGGGFIAVSTIFLAIGPRFITSPEVALLVLLESIIAPILVWLVIGEDPGEWALIGGAIVISVLFISNMLALVRRKSKTRP
jgi:drug/metabolite transporter (DMT)-like permease